jgi:protein required for attachment to host cells
MVYEKDDSLAARPALVVVADAVQAQLYTRDHNTAPLQNVKTLQHPEGRAKERELTSDVSGDTFDSHGFGRHSIEADYSVKQHELQLFAREIAATIEQMRTAGAFIELMLVAPPKLLGALRDQLSSSARQALRIEIPNRLTDATPEAVAQALREA